MSVSVVAGRDVIKTDADQVIAILEEKLQQLKSGEISANRMFLVLTDASVDSFWQDVLYYGRVTEVLGLNEIAKMALLNDTGAV